MRGVYTLIIRFAASRRITIGRRLSVLLKRGPYLYTGSALGKSSTSLEGRIGRHLRRHKKSFWHIDRILSSDSAHVVSVIFSKTTSKAECRVNGALLTDPDLRVLVKGIGSSDCKCESHFLAAGTSLSALQQKVRVCYRNLGLRPRTLKYRTTDVLSKFAVQLSR